MSALLAAAQEAFARWEDHRDPAPLCAALEQIIACGDAIDRWAARTLANDAALLAWQLHRGSATADGLESRFVALARRCAETAGTDHALRGRLRRLLNGRTSVEEH